MGNLLNRKSIPGHSILFFGGVWVWESQTVLRISILGCYRKERKGKELYLSVKSF